MMRSEPARSGYSLKSNIPTYLLILAVSLAIFLYLFPFNILDPTSTSWIWREADFQQHFLGWQFFVNESFYQWPLTNLTSLGNGIARSIIFTDSIPLVALLLKPVARFSGLEIQYFGIFIWLSIFLQALFSFHYLLAKRLPPSQALPLCFLPAISPPVLFRATCHTSLTAQWLILAALLLCETKRFRFYLWISILSLALWIHLYFFAMLFPLFSLKLTRCLREKSRAQFLGVRKFLIGFALILSQLYALGYLPRNASDAGSSGYGLFTTNLLSLFSSYPNFSVLYPSFRLPYGSEEGIIFFGSIVSLMALVVLSTGPGRAVFLSSLRRDKSLLLLLMLMLLYSISPRISISNYSHELFSLPHVFQSFANIFRASGRFAWPIYYFVFLSFLVSFPSAIASLSQQRFKRISLALICCCMLFFQLADLSTYASERRVQFQSHFFEDPIIKVVEQTITDLEVDYPSKIIYFPNFGNPPKWSAFARFALRHNASTNGVYLARYDNDKMNEQDALNRSHFLSNRLDRTALYVLTDPSYLNGLHIGKCSPSKPSTQSIDHCLLEPGENEYILLPLSARR